MICYGLMRNKLTGDYDELGFSKSCNWTYVTYYWSDWQTLFCSANFERFSIFGGLLEFIPLNIDGWCGWQTWQNWKIKTCNQVHLIWVVEKDEIMQEKNSFFCLFPFWFSRSRGLTTSEWVTRTQIVRWTTGQKSKVSEFRERDKSWASYWLSFKSLKLSSIFFFLFQEYVYFHSNTCVIML